jgi:hypothetical protein
MKKNNIAGLMGKELDNENEDEKLWVIER